MEWQLVVGIGLGLFSICFCTLGALDFLRAYELRHEARAFRSQALDYWGNAEQANTQALKAWERANHCWGRGVDAWDKAHKAEHVVRRAMSWKENLN